MRKPKPIEVTAMDMRAKRRAEERARERNIFMPDREPTPNERRIGHTGAPTGVKATHTARTSTRTAPTVKGPGRSGGTTVTSNSSMKKAVKTAKKSSGPKRVATKPASKPSKPAKKVTKKPAAKPTARKTTTAKRTTKPAPRKRVATKHKRV